MVGYALQVQVSDTVITNHVALPVEMYKKWLSLILWSRRRIVPLWLRRSREPEFKAPICNLQRSHDWRTLQEEYEHCVERASENGAVDEACRTEICASVVFPSSKFCCFTFPTHVLSAAGFFAL